MARGKLPIFERRSTDGRLLGYQVKIRKKGYPTVARQFDRMADAERFARDELKKMDDGVWVDRKEVQTTTLAEALDRYQLEITPGKRHPRNEELLIGRWQRHELAARFLETIKPGDLARYRDERLAAGASGNTVRIELALISHLYTIGRKEWDWPLANPVQSIRGPKIARGRERRLDLKPDADGQTEEGRLLVACRESRSPWLAPIVTLAVETGMRQGELVSLLWEHVDLDRGTAHLPLTKNGTARTVPLSPTAIRVLRQLPRSIDGRVFPLEAKTVAHDFVRACKKAGIAGLRFHDLRHEATSRLFEHGLAIQEVAAITGHKTLQMLKRYTHLRAEDLAVKLARLAEL